MSKSRYVSSKFARLSCLTSPIIFSCFVNLDIFWTPKSLITLWAIVMKCHLEAD